MGANFSPRSTAVGGISVLPSDCTTMLVDVDSHVPVSVGAAPHGTQIDLNATSFGAPFYFWSGSVPLEPLSVVLSVSDPGAGVSLTSFDPSYDQGGNASFGFVFSANDC